MILLFYLPCTKKAKIWTKITTLPPCFRKYQFIYPLNSITLLYWFEFSKVSTEFCFFLGSFILVFVFLTSSLFCKFFNLFKVIFLSYSSMSWVILLYFLHIIISKLVNSFPLLLALKIRNCYFRLHNLIVIVIVLPRRLLTLNFFVSYWVPRGHKCLHSVLFISLWKH